MDQKDSACKYTGLDRVYSVSDLAAFHGHLGPYIVLGYRIGRYAKESFCSDPFQMKAVVFCQGAPPQSCLADGIQIGSGCTLGKKNIEIVVSNEIAVEFSQGERKTIIRPRPISFLPLDGEGSDRLIEKLAEEMYATISDSDLFSVEVAGDIASDQEKSP